MSRPNPRPPASAPRALATIRLRREESFGVTDEDDSETVFHTISRASTGKREHADPRRDEISRRLIACWNALEGIPTGVIEELNKNRSIFEQLRIITGFSENVKPGDSINIKVVD